MKKILLGIVFISAVMISKAQGTDSTGKKITE